MIRLKHIVLLLAVVMAWPTLAQDKKSDQLKAKQRALQQKIANTKKMIGSSQTSQRVTMTELAIINQQVAYREELISTYTYQIRRLDRQIEETESVIESLENNLVTLKEEYAELLNMAYKYRNSYYNMMFIFAAESFNQAYKRVKYLSQFAEYRKKQVDLIKATKEDLSEKIVELEQKKEVKKGTISSKESEKANYLNDKENRQQILSKLQTEQKKLENQLTSDQSRQKKLSKQIKKAIEEEIAAAARASKEKFTLRPEVKLASKTFEKNKAKLPWPVKEGEIVNKFGKHPHPVIKNVIVENNGVDIATNKGAAVRSIFAGEVTSIFVIPGAGKAVMISHGAYRSVYANLEVVAVNKGDKVKTMDTIGSLIPKEGEKVSELHFEIWKITSDNMYKQNPAHWLAK